MVGQHFLYSPSCALDLQGLFITPQELIPLNNIHLITPPLSPGDHHLPSVLTYYGIAVKWDKLVLGEFARAWRRVPNEKSEGPSLSLLHVTETLDITAAFDTLSSLGVCDAVLVWFSSSSHATFCFRCLYFPLLCISIAHAHVTDPLFFIPPAALSRVGVCLQDTLNDARTLEALPSQPIIPQWKTHPSDTPNTTLEHILFPCPPLPTLRLCLALNPQRIFKILFEQLICSKALYPQITSVNYISLSQLYSGDWACLRPSHLTRVTWLVGDGPGNLHAGWPHSLVCAFLGTSLRAPSAVAIFGNYLIPVHARLWRAFSFFLSASDTKFVICNFGESLKSRYFISF